MTTIPIVVGVASAILWRTFAPAGLSAGVYQWVYSTVVQAFAAMVAVVGMFAIYKLQFLRHSLDFEAEKLGRAVANYNEHKKHFTETPLAVPVEISNDFVADWQTFQKLEQQILQDNEYIVNRLEEIGKRVVEEPSKDGKTVLKTLREEDKREHDNLQSIKTDLLWVYAPYTKIKIEKTIVMSTTKAVKVPLVISGCLIVTSLLLLSLSDKNIIDAASSLFLWFLAGVIGTAICLTYMLIREILVLVEA